VLMVSATGAFCQVRANRRWACGLAQPARADEPPGTSTQAPASGRAGRLGKRVRLWVPTGSLPNRGQRNRALIHMSALAPSAEQLRVRAPDADACIGRGPRQARSVAADDGHEHEEPRLCAMRFAWPRRSLHRGAILRQRPRVSVAERRIGIEQADLANAGGAIVPCGRTPSILSTPTKVGSSIDLDQ
jgi:hypothetical protein